MLVKDTDALMGIEGAGLLNILYLQKGAVVVDLKHPFAYPYAGTTTSHSVLAVKDDVFAMFSRAVCVLCVCVC
jgi:hypothetical protein